MTGLLLLAATAAQAARVPAVPPPATTAVTGDPQAHWPFAFRCSRVLWTVWHEASPTKSAIHCSSKSSCSSHSFARVTVLHMPCCTCLSG